MPQFDFSTYAGQIVWLFLTFTFLYGVVTWFFLPRIRGGLMKREETLSAWLSEASSLRESAETMARDADRRLREVREEGKERVKRALDEMKKRQEEEEREVLLRMEAKGEEVRKDLEGLWKEWEEDLAVMSDELASHVVVKMGEGSGKVKGA